LNPFLRPFWKDDPSFNDLDRDQLYGAWTSQVEVAEECEGASFAMMPMSWNYYYSQGKVGEAMQFVAKAKSAGLRIYSWTSGDYGIRSPDPDVYVMRCSGYGSKLTAKEITLPVFIEDPLTRYAGYVRQKGRLPVVGFCGQAYSPPHRACLDLVRTSYRNSLYWLGIKREEPQAMYPATLKRATVLGKLQGDKRIKTDFIIRRSYRAGAAAPEERQRTTNEYFHNILSSDYVVCIRGNGNFSARLYETLACGRIPIIVNTDCHYPCMEVIQWRDIGVWIEFEDIESLPQKVVDFHSVQDDFYGLQSRARSLWIKNLSYEGFWSNFVNIRLHSNKHDGKEY
jgi:hypothetical protein